MNTKDVKNIILTILYSENQIKQYKVKLFIEPDIKQNISGGKIKKTNSSKKPKTKKK